MSKVVLSHDAARLLSRVSQLTHIVHISVAARLTPGESGRAIELLVDEGLITVEVTGLDSWASLTELGKQMQRTRDYDICEHPREQRNNKTLIRRTR